MESKKSVKLQTGIKTSTGIEKKSKKLKNKPKRKKPKFDFEEGLRCGLLQAWSISMREAMKAPLSGLYTLSKTLFKAQGILEDLVENYSYGPEEIQTILKGAGIKNPEFFLEYIMNDGKPKERTCSHKDCVVIMTNETLFESFDCGRHQEDEDV